MQWYEVWDVMCEVWGVGCSGDQRKQLRKPRRTEMFPSENWEQEEEQVTWGGDDDVRYVLVWLGRVEHGINLLSRFRDELVGGLATYSPTPAGREWTLWEGWNRRF